MVANHTKLTRQRFCRLYKGSIAARFAERDFDRITREKSATALTSERIQQDIQQLERACNGYMPNVGDSFQVLIFGSRSGDFAVENGLDLGDGLRLDPQFDAGSLTLVTTEGNAPPPGGAARPNSKGSQPMAELEEAILGIALDSPSAEASWQSLAVTNKGTMARNRLDSFFRLLA